MKNDGHENEKAKQSWKNVRENAQEISRKS